MRKDTTEQDGQRNAVTVGAKKPYRAPRLATHGDLRKLALGSGGRKGDGKGKASSKG
jgi:hypothetical protein